MLFIMGILFSVASTMAAPPAGKPVIQPKSKPADQLNSAKEASKPESLTTPVEIALNWKAEPQFGGFYAATGIKPIEGGSGTPTVQMLANGKVDFAIVSAEEILISNERNPKNPILAVFAVYKTNPQMIMCHAEKGFKNLREVMASPVTLAWQNGLTYVSYLKSKYPAAKVKAVPYQGGVGPFLADPNLCQQGFATSEPLTAARSGAKVSTFLISDEGFNPYTTVLAVRLDTLAKDSQRVGLVVQAVRAGWESYIKNPAATNTKMEAINKSMDADTFAKSAAAQEPLLNPGGGMTPARWRQLAEQLVALKVIQKMPEVNKNFRNF